MKTIKKPQKKFLWTGIYWNTQKRFWLKKVYEVEDQTDLFSQNSHYYYFATKYEADEFFNKSIW